MFEYLQKLLIFCVLFIINQAVIATGEREGEGRYKIKWSKVTHKFTAQPVLEKKNYNYLKEIISEAMANVENGQKVNEKATKYCMAPTDKGDRNDIIAKTIKYARFQNFIYKLTIKHV